MRFVNNGIVICLLLIALEFALYALAAHIIYWRGRKQVGRKQDLVKFRLCRLYGAHFINHFPSRRAKVIYRRYDRLTIVSNFILIGTCIAFLAITWHKAGL